jgi:hypothetical protein
MTTDQDRLIAALSAPSPAPDDGYLTFREIMATMTIGEQRLRAMLRSLAETGRLDCKRIPRRAITGDVQLVPGYRLVDVV